MAKKMLIDASHSEETRVTIVSGNKLEEFDFETASKKQLKGNVYLALVTRVEPSLQAAFVEYGGNRHGFLAFNEIHPDYYQIPAEDREVEEVEEIEEDDVAEESGEDSDVETMGDDGEEEQEQAKKRRPKLKRQYKIQEVIKKRQVMLIQVNKEERGNKGAAITTYLSLAGRYCVLMPNTSRGGGVSRKITNQADRKRLKTVLSEMEKPKGMGVIVRTAGAGRTKVEVKRDYEYTFRLWDKIREKTLKSVAPTLIHEEASLIHRAIRDMYNKEIDEVIVAGDKGYKDAKAFMKELTPSHAKKVQAYKDETGIPLFQRYQVEGQLSHIYDTTAQLKSGGSIVMNQTEALVAIDVNSGRATKERHIDDTALKTNLEAAEEVARQLRLRDMAGLIVIDFIDMDCNKAIAQVERKLKEALRKDRARIQVGRISQFGLMEMSRQRLRPSLIEATSSICPACAGSGSVPSTEVAAMMVVRAIEEEAMRRRSRNIFIAVPSAVGFYLLNSKRKALTEIEINFEVTVSISANDELVAPAYELNRDSLDGDELTQTTKADAHKDDHDAKRKRNNRNRRGTGRRDEDGEERKPHDNRPKDKKSNDAKSNENNPNYNKPHKHKKHDNKSDPNKPNETTASQGGERVEGLDTDAADERRRANNRRRRNRKNRNAKRYDADGNLVAVENGVNKSSGEADSNNNAKNNSADTVNQVVSEKAPQSKEGFTNNAQAGKDKKPAKKFTKKTIDDKPKSENKVAEKKVMSDSVPVAVEPKAKKASGKESTVKKATAKKATAKKTTAKKATAKKATTKKATAKKATAKKATAKKATAKKVTAKKALPKIVAVEAKTPAVPKKSGWWSL